MVKLADCAVCGTPFVQLRSDFVHCSDRCNFWSFVDRTQSVPRYPHLTPCWTWKGGVDEYGYGFYLDKKEKDVVRAHRYSWQITFGPLDKSILVLHECDNPSCVRPDHFRSGTNEDNTADKIAKGRWRLNPLDSYGPMGLPKLTEEQVSEIRRRATSESARSLARSFGISRSNISMIINRKTWKDVP